MAIKRTHTSLVAINRNQRRTRAFVALLSMSARRNAFVTSPSEITLDAPSWAHRGSGTAARLLTPPKLGLELASPKLGTAARLLAASAAGDLGASC